MRFYVTHARKTNTCVKPNTEIRRARICSILLKKKTFCVFTIMFTPFMYLMSGLFAHFYYPKSSIWTCFSDWTETTQINYSTMDPTIFWLLARWTFRFNVNCDEIYTDSEKNAFFLSFLFVIHHYVLFHFRLLLLSLFASLVVGLPSLCSPHASKCGQCKRTLEFCLFYLDVCNRSLKEIDHLYGIASILCQCECALVQVVIICSGFSRLRQLASISTGFDGPPQIKTICQLFKSHHFFLNGPE